MYALPLILLVLGTAALALPTNNTIEVSLLEKRVAIPWLKDYDDDDGSCLDLSGDTSSDARPNTRSGKCEPYQPQTGRVGGSWGAGMYKISSFWAFENSDCTGAVKARINQTDGEAGFCFPLSILGCVPGEDVGNPCYWNSVRGNK